MNAEEILQYSLVVSNVNKNVNGGYYRRGVAKTLVEKIDVAGKWIEMSNDCENIPSIRALAKSAKVSRIFATKVVDELKEGQIIDPKSLVKDIPRGKGSKSITDEDGVILLRMRSENNQRSLQDYRLGLHKETGKWLSRSVICQWFLQAHEFRGSVRKLSQVPIDKLKPDNILRAVEYATIIDKLPIDSIKFIDEKHLKGQELFNRDGRACPLTGNLEPILVDSDFRNSHTIMGCCGISPTSNPFYFWMHNGTNDAALFADFVYQMVIEGFLKARDVIVMDNASIHCYREAAVLEEILWVDYQILIVFMPARSPELNPIELLWHILVQRLKIVPLDGNHSSERTVKAAKDIMDSFTHSDVISCYRKCKYIQ